MIKKYLKFLKEGVSKYQYGCVMIDFNFENWKELSSNIDKNDIYEKEDNLIILSTIAGIKPEDIDITVEPDLIIIRGERKKQIPKDSICHIQECFWGKFSRTLVLPSPVKPDKVEADLKNGVLTIILPKAGELSRGVKVEE